MKKVEGEEIRKLKDVPRGEYVRRVRADGTPYGPVRIKGDYDRSCKGFECTNANDICNVPVWGGATRVLVGFTY